MTDDRATEAPGKGLPLDRADELVGSLLDRARMTAARAAALAREEVEDIVAEARAVRTESAPASQEGEAGRT